MRFTAISVLFLAAAAVDAAAVEKRACVEYIGNSWGCDAPVGQPQNWNYCQVRDPNYPVRLTPNSPFLFYRLTMVLGESSAHNFTAVA